MSSTSSLTTRLSFALSSRKDRQILRRLPSDSTKHLIDFTSNDYLSLSTSSRLRQLFLKKISSAPQVLGSGGSRLLINPPTHAALESRLVKFFAVESALLFNSGFDANVGFFSCVPAAGDVVVFDEYIHASVYDGLRASRVRVGDRLSFQHNCLSSFRAVLERVKLGRDSNVFVAVESLYSMDGTFAPLTQITNIMNELFPDGNVHLVVDEAHATGIYGPQGRGRVAELGLENRVLARLCTFGKALGGSGGEHFYTSH